jgi:hypothetical protein
MADFNAIRDVSLTIQQLLHRELGSLVPPAICTLNDLSQPIGFPPPHPTLTVTLYEAIEDPSARNRPNVRRVQGNKVAVRRPPVALLLRYLITPWSGQPDSDHQILGRAIQILYDNAIISGPLLMNPSRLFDADEAIKLTMVPLTLEDRTHVWRSVNQPYRLSANYEVRVVHIESLAERQYEPVSSRRLEFVDAGTGG